MNNKFDRLIHATSTVWAYNATIRNKLNAVSNNFANWYHCNSRSLYNAFNHTIYKYFSGISPYRALAAFCNLLAPITKQIRIKPYYTVISTNDSQTNTLENYMCTMQNIPGIATTDIHIIHIPKGKSFLKTMFEQHTENVYVRANQAVETFIAGDIPFLRIYTTNEENPSNYWIFTESANSDMINRLFVMLPNLLNLQPNESFSEEINTKISALRNIFEECFKLYQKKDEENDHKLTIEEEKTFAKLCDDYIALFDFTTETLDNFSANLAKAKNAITTTHIQRKLNNVNHDIENYETRLQNAYVEQMNLSRRLAAAVLTSEEDVKPFMQTLKTTPAIEILEMDSNKLLLRVTAPFQYFTPADLETLENNKNSDYYRYVISKPYLKELLHKVFVTQEYKLLTQGMIKLEINDDSYYDTPLNINARTYSLDNFTQFPNPHLFHHNCWAAAKQEMTKNICAGNYELVVMQMVAAVQSINLAEHTSFVNGFVYDIVNNNNIRKLATFVDKDGNTYNYTQMLDKIEQEENAKVLAEAKEIIDNAEGYVQIELPDDDEE